jgi:two-component system cell cycle sensor histidine kinase/response regulator CckA
VKDVPRNQPESARTAGLPRPVKQEAAEIPLLPPEPPARPRGDPNDEVRRLQEQIGEYRRTLDQWIQAEAEWQSEREFFRLITDHVSDLAALLNAYGHRTWINPAYAHALGQEVGELTDTHAFSQVHPDDLGRVTEAFEHALQNASTHQLEFRVQKKDGDWLNLQVVFIPLPGHEGRTESVLLLAADRTENAKLTEALALASTTASAATLVEGMARDFDQILTTVVGNLTIAKNLNGPHNAIAVRLNEMERSLQRARDLIEQMFSITPHEGQPKVRVACEPVVQEAVSAVLRGTMIRAEYLFPRNLPEVQVDREALSHAIRNIVTNSVQAMDKGVVRFSAEYIPLSQFSYRPDLPLKAGDYICLHIQDQGHGISEKALSRVFEPYFTTRSGSQGLGLTTALTSIQRMGGTILIESTPGVGTTLSLYIPAMEGAPPGTMPLSALAKAAADRTPTQALPSPLLKRRILLMDDEQMILDIVSRMLGHLGYEVTTCTDGSQAIAAFAKAKSHGEPFDVVMMDLVIPNGVGGQDAVHTIKKIDPGAKVIASSGHLEHPVMLDLKKFGFNATLEKPYKLERLQQVIEAAINAPAA